MPHSRQMVVTLVTLALTVVLVACGGSGGADGPAIVKSEHPNTPINLDGTEWVLTSLNGSDLVEGSNITLNFAEGQLNGFAGCNTYFAAYTLDGAFLTVEAVAATEMACLELAGVMEQEQHYLGFLKDVTIYRIYGRQLWLETDDGRALVFTAQE